MFESLVEVMSREKTKKRLVLGMLFFFPLIYVIIWGRHSPYFDEIWEGAILLAVGLLLLGFAWALLEGILAVIEWLWK